MQTMQISARAMEFGKESGILGTLPARPAGQPPVGPLNSNPSPSLKSESSQCLVLDLVCYLQVQQKTNDMTLPLGSDIRLGRAIERAPQSNMSGSG